MFTSTTSSILTFLLSKTAFTSAWSPTHSIHRPLLPPRTSTHLHNNVVLRPSTEPSAFDSLKIGTARVHRYIRDEGEDEMSADYVMWYHGRSSATTEEKKLPPLSTGRIGRATSRNGLHWYKETEGAESEDHPGVSLGLNTESWWGFDTAHVGLGTVLLPMSTPSVITEGGVYLMYFFGGSFEENDISNYLDLPAEKSKDLPKIAGMKMRIGVAVSQDGQNWGRIEGDDPSGACVTPFDSDDPVQQQMTKQGLLDPNLEEELYCGWPDVVVDLTPGVTETYTMYYSTMTKHDKRKCIARATSPDGFRWKKKGVCLIPDTDLDAEGCARCHVIKDAVFNENGRWVENSGWTMFYEGVSKEDNKHRVLIAKSEDGVTWDKVGVVLDVGEGDAWDSHGVGCPNILRLDDGTLRMYYTGQAAGGSTAIGVARAFMSDSDSIKFEREQSEFVFSSTEA